MVGCIGIFLILTIILIKVKVFERRENVVKVNEI